MYRYVPKTQPDDDGMLGQRRDKMQIDFNHNQEQEDTGIPGLERVVCCNEYMKIKLTKQKRRCLQNTRIQGKNPHSTFSDRK